jgi:hypothetical protein
MEHLHANVTRSRDGEHPSLAAWARRLVRELALQDWLMLVYYGVLIGAVAIFGTRGAARNDVLLKLGAQAAWLVAALVAVRGSLLKQPVVVALVYRITLFGTLQFSYLMLKSLLPVVSDRVLDAQLFHLDLQVFGFEPSLWMDQFVSGGTTEWFAFFYYLYFAVLLLHSLPFMFLSRDMKMFAELSIGMLVTFTVAHSLYMAVPGYGPYKFLATAFHHQLPAGFWMRQVLEAVHSVGAQKDIFPSLHTAGPMFILFFSFRNRDKFPFKYTWPVTAFVAVNIMLATMFLRWHYVIDIVAGITLAATSCYLVGWLARRECSRREAQGLQPVFSQLWPEKVIDREIVQPGAPPLHSAHR